MPKSKQDQLELSISLQAQLDPRSLARVSASLDRLARDPREIFDSRQLEKLAGLASKVQKSFIDAGRPTAQALDQFQDKFTELIRMYQVAQDDFTVGLQNADEAAVKAAQERLNLIQAGMEGLAKETVARVDFEPTTRNLVKTGKMIGDSFTDTLDSLKAGDLKGLAKALFSSAAKATTHAAERKAAQAAIQGAMQGRGAAEGLATVATKLGTAAVALSGVGAVVTALIGLLVAADQREKELNQSIMDGAGIADWSFTSMNQGVEGLTDNLRMSYRAAQDLAIAFRGDAKEYTGILSALQQSGYTFRELTLGAENSEEAQESLRRTMQNVAVSAKALGISFGEAATQFAEFHETYGLGQQQTYEQFLAIATAAQNSSMGTKRFFTSVSQATSGMALYNVRMEEAAELLNLTSKILGGADASDFIKSLTKGFSEESFQETTRRVLIAGQGDTNRIISDSAKRSARAFADNFAANMPLLQQALSNAKLNLDVSTFTDQDTLIQAMSTMSDKDRGAIIYALQELNTDESRNMAEQLYQLNTLVKGTQGLGKQVLALSNADMQAKLAMIMQNILGDNKRIADLGIRQLMALESTTGMSKDQILKLGRVQEYLYGMYLQDKRGFDTFEQFVSGADLTNLHLDDQTQTLKTAEEYMSEVASNTESIFNVFRNYFDKFLTRLTFISDGIGKLARHFSGEPMALSSSEQDFKTKTLQEQKAAKDLQLVTLNRFLREASARNDTSAVEEFAKSIAQATAELRIIERSLSKVAAGVDPELPSEKSADMGAAQALLAKKLAETYANDNGATETQYLRLLQSDRDSFKAWFEDLAAHPELAPLKQLAIDAGVPVAQDFIMRPGTPAQRFSSADTVLGFKDNGPIDKVLGNNGSGTTINNFNLYGGDTATIYNTIRTATKVSRGK